MSRLGEFIAFEAAVSLLKERGMENVITDTYLKCKEAFDTGYAKEDNFVKHIYARFTEDEISDKIASIITPPNMRSSVKVIYQSLENLHIACPDHLGDWYFSGDYPTPGGNKVVNRAYMNWVEGKNQRAY